MVAPERIVFTDEWYQPGKPTEESIVTVTFEEQGSKTLLTIRTRFDSPEARQGAAAQGFVAGWGEFLDSLTAHLAKA